MKDTFKRTAPTIEFFKDGETIRVKKLGKMIDEIQSGMASLEAAVGDIHNRAVTFEAAPLFQNSLGRSVGQMDQLTVFPVRTFSVVEKTKQSLHQGLIRWPNSDAVASVAGNLSMNLLPMVRQEDKTGIGCIRDDGTKCTAGYQSIYDKEKSLLPNSIFQQGLALSGWDTTDATIKDGGGAELDIAYRYNLLKYSENFENWTINGPALVLQRDQFADPNGQNAAYKIETTTDTDTFASIETFGSGLTTSQDWCFAVWIATSGERDTYLAISGAVVTNLLSGSLEGAPFTIFDPYPSYHAYLGLSLSGLEWKRYYVHAHYGSPVAASSLLCQVILNISGRIDPTPVFLFGGQLEPTNYPTTYRRTQGSTTSGLGTEVSVGYNLSVIPGHTYQVTVAGSGAVQLRLDGSNLFTLSPTVTSTTFTATADTAVIDAYVSGTSASSNYLTLFRIDPGTPCHAMNCPGLSAYDKVRSYRAVLPAQTVSGHQYFATRLQLPDEFQHALFSELPGNILGVFDHELNHAVPDQIVDWKLANWPIGGLSLGGLLADPEFLTLWTTSSGNVYPTELIPTAGSGVVTRDISITDFFIVNPGLAPEALGYGTPWLYFVGDDVSGIDGTAASGWVNRGSGASFSGLVGGSWTTITVPTLATIHGHKALKWQRNHIGSGSCGEGLHVVGGSHNLGSGNYTMLLAYKPEDEANGGWGVLLGNAHPVNLGFQFLRTINTSGVNNTSAAAYWTDDTHAQIFTNPILDPDTNGTIITKDSLVLVAITRSGTQTRTYWVNPSGDFQTLLSGSLSSGIHLYSDLGILKNDTGGFVMLSGVAILEYVAFSGLALSSGEIGNILLHWQNKFQYGNYLVPSQSLVSGQIVVSGTYSDRVIITVSGNDQKGLIHTFPLSVGQVYTLDYRVKAELSYSGIFENFVVASGAAEVDLLLDSNYQAINSSGLTNQYKVSATEPGLTGWSEDAPGGFWSIRRRFRATQDGTLVNITVGLSGNASAQSATFDSLDMNVQSSNSTIFKYQADPVLGLNWEGTATHVIEENLWPWSERLGFSSYTDSNTFDAGLTDPSGLPTATRIQGYGIETDGNLDLILDNTITMQFWARSNNPSAGNSLAHVYFADGADSQTQEYTVTEQWQPFSFMFSGIDRANASYIYWEIVNPDPGGEQEIAWLTLHHGSGLIPYEKTDGRPIRRYRHALRVDQYRQLRDWESLYGLVGGLPIQTNLTATSFSGILFETDTTQVDFLNFPSSGVIRVLGQEFAYRGKQADGKFIDCVPKWRGTNFDETLLVSGSRVTYVPLPRAVDRIETDLVWFKETLPAADGDWASNVHLQLYNTQVSNLSRYSLTAAAIPLTKAAGTLMTAFMSHVADDARHFRRDQLCAALVDPSIYAGFSDMEVRLNVVHSPVEEVNQPGILEIFAFGFMNSNEKQVTINWGDDNTDIITSTGQHFDSIEHTYDLGAGTRARQHTISVEVRDLNLLVTRSATVSIIVTPVSKGSQTVRAVIITQPTATSQARTAIWAQTSGLLQSRTYVI